MFFKYFILMQFFALEILLSSTNPEEYAEPQFRKSQKVPVLNLSFSTLRKPISDEDLSNIRALPLDEKKKIGLNENAREFSPSWLTPTSGEKAKTFPTPEENDDLFQEPTSSRPKLAQISPPKGRKKYLPPYERTHESIDVDIDDYSAVLEFDETMLPHLFPRDRIVLTSSEGVTRSEFGTMIGNVPSKPKKGRCPLPLAPKEK